MRLIDADLLKKNIAKWLQSGDPQETEMVKLDDIAVSVIMEIDEQPTAFDVERVVEEINGMEVVIPIDYISADNLKIINEVLRVVKDGALEELKAYNEIGTVEECKDAVESIERFYQIGYNMAIDDYVERLKEAYKPRKAADNYMYTNVCRRFDDIAEQLKEGCIDGSQRTDT